MDNGETAQLLNEVRTKVQTMSVELRHTNSEIAKQTEIVKDLQRTVKGNGVPGLVLKVEKLADRVGLLMWAAGLIATPIIGGVGFMIVRLIGGGE